MVVVVGRSGVQGGGGTVSGSHCLPQVLGWPAKQAPQGAGESHGTRPLKVAPKRADTGYLGSLPYYNPHLPPERANAVASLSYPE